MEAASDELTPAKQALLDSLLRGDGDGAALELAVAWRIAGEPVPLSLAQEHFWLLEHLDPGNLAYHRPCILRVRGRLNGAVLERSLNEIVRPP